MLKKKNHRTGLQGERNLKKGGAAVTGAAFKRVMNILRR